MKAAHEGEDERFTTDTETQREEIQCGVNFVHGNPSAALRVNTVATPKRGTNPHFHGSAFIFARTGLSDG
jgi:hypothetical protein